MIRVFAYLTWHTLRNRVGRQLRQLRNPRYALAFLLGGAYLAWVLVGQRSGQPPLTLEPARVELVGALLVLGVVAWAWVFGLERRVLAFTPAEVTFLFSAPIRRRDLIQYKLLRTQLLVLFNSVLWTLILSAGRSTSSAWLRMLAIWVLLSTLTMHRLGASFVRTSLSEHGVYGARHRVLSLLALGAVIAALVASLATALPEIAAAAERGIGAVLGAIATASERPVAATLLWPFRALVRPLAAHTPREWLAAMGPAVALLVLHYVWVIRSDAAFEEAAVAASMRRADDIAARRQNDGQPGRPTRMAGASLPLRPTGHPAIAIVWKNVLAVLRTRRVHNILLVLGMVAAGSAVLATTLQGSLDQMIGGLAATWALFLVVMGPQWVRNDLRSDLRKLDLLRTYPVTGRALVAAEVASSTIALSLLQLALLAAAYIAFLGGGIDLPLQTRTAIVVAAVVALPAVNYMGLLIHNAAALLYPAWVHLGSGRPGGVEALGQNLLTMLAFVFVLAAALAAPGALAFGVWWVANGFGWWALVPAAAALAAGLAAESAVLLRWLGGVFERTDVTAAGLEVA